MSTFTLTLGLTNSFSLWAWLSWYQVDKAQRLRIIWKLISNRCFSFCINIEPWIVMNPFKNFIHCCLLIFSNDSIGELRVGISDSNDIKEEVVSNLSSSFDIFNSKISLNLTRFICFVSELLTVLKTHFYLTK